MAEQNPMNPLHFLIENLLNQDVPNTPRDAVTARLMAAHARAHGAGNDAARFLKLARDIIEAKQPLEWRDALRANVEHGLQLASIGMMAEAQPVLERAREILDTYFGLHSEGSRCLSELIGSLKRINDGGCCGCGGCAREVQAVAKG